MDSTEALSACVPRRVYALYDTSSVSRQSPVHAAVEPPGATDGQAPRLSSSARARPDVAGLVRVGVAVGVRGRVRVRGRGRVRVRGAPPRP